MTKTPWASQNEHHALQRLTLALVETCVRNTILEDWHAGREVVSPAGDFSDVKIVTPTGEIPYLDASRISDEEMKALMRHVVDAVFTFLSYPDQPIRLGGAAQWDKPKLNPTMASGILRQIAIRNGLDPAVAYAHDDPTIEFSPLSGPQA
jgi:hypothetical protein